MHFGTFIGAESESLEAIIELAEAVEDAGVKALDDPNEDELGRMGVIDIGETWCTESESFPLATRCREGDPGRSRTDKSETVPTVHPLLIVSSA